MTEARDPVVYVIEFRSGTYFRSLDDDHGVGIGQARRFATMREADDLMEENEWILFAGGCVIKVKL